MIDGGWMVNAPHQDNSYTAGCGGFNTFWGYSYGPPVGFVEARFKGSGTATLDFGNCCCGITKVYVNGHTIGSAAGGKQSEVISFNYKSGDILKVTEEAAGILKINSLKLEACKQEGKIIIKRESFEE